VAEPEWPAIDFSVSNPPFLRGKKLRSGLGGDELLAKLLELSLSMRDGGERST
jgi:hypothetical protein